MKKKFNDAAATRFGSGWAWLGVKADGSLGITSTANQDNPLMKGIAEVEMIPILGLDVWEHAYCKFDRSILLAFPRGVEVLLPAATRLIPLCRPQVPEPTPRVHSAVVERGQLGQGGRVL